MFCKKFCTIVLCQKFFQKSNLLKGNIFHIVFKNSFYKKNIF